MNVLLRIESMIYLKHKSNKGPASHAPIWQFPADEQASAIQQFGSENKSKLHDP